MEARKVNSFTRGGDPYRKLGVGRHREPPTHENIDFVIEQIYGHWFDYSDDGIATLSFIDDTGHGRKVQIEAKHMDRLTKDKRNELQHLIIHSLELSGIRHYINIDPLSYDIYLYYRWR